MIIQTFMEFNIGYVYLVAQHDICYHLVPELLVWDLGSARCMWVEIEEKYSEATKLSKTEMKVTISGWNK